MRLSANCCGGESFFCIFEGRRQIDRTEDHTRSGWHSPCTDPHRVRNRREKQGAEHLLLAGVKTRGIYLAQRIAAKLGEVEGKAPPVLELDVTPWRDDVPRTDAPLPDLDPRIAGATVIIVDDVLYTGRTVRAAIEAISHRGRSRAHTAGCAGRSRSPRTAAAAGLYGKNRLPRVMNAFLSA